LIQYNVKLDRADAAERWLEALRVQAPDDPALKQLEEQIDARRDAGTTRMPPDG
jgi:predicted Zn-dependent protease